MDGIERCLVHSYSVKKTGGREDFNKSMLDCIYKQYIEVNVS